MPKHRIIPQMFDVRPVDQTGDLDWKKIVAVAKIKHCAGDDPYAKKLRQLKHAEKLAKDEKRKKFLEQEIERMSREHQRLEEENAKYRQEKETELRKQKEVQQAERERQIAEQAQKQKEELKQIEELEAQERKRREEIVLQERRQLEIEKALWIKQELEQQEEKKRLLEQAARAKESALRSAIAEKKIKKPLLQAGILKRKKRPVPVSQMVLDDSFSLRDLFSFPRLLLAFDARRSAFVFAAAAVAIVLGVGSVSYVSKGFGVKGQVLGVSQEGFSDLTAAMQSMAGKNFDGSSAQFAQAYGKFSQASSQLDQMGGLLIDASRFVPFASRLSTGKNAVEAGKHISSAGQALNGVAENVESWKHSLNQSDQGNISLLDMFQKTHQGVATARTELKAAQENIDAINVDDLPSDKQAQFVALKQQLPPIMSMFESFTDNGNIFIDLLGGNGQRKYLFLFQNNNEMRATGGFIGSYGLLDISNGKIQNFFIDGIFNPDGQLRDKIVPPGPIQKISAAWSLHDSNWFPDFPTSAREAMKFYEKTGGPTVDGVITLTPAVMQKLLAITGPVDMPDYGVTLTADNFVEKTQYEVEVDYDRQENKPKKILSDLAPIVLDRIFNAKDASMVPKALSALSEGLQEKHILLYSDNADVQKLISQQGWSGEVLPAGKDYVSVINTNINGFKTDGAIKESISHSAKVQEDGSIVDTVSITRKHSGGNSEFDWYNKVNADYMRVYVPLGSQLLDAQGQTQETNKPPLDYDALGFKRDELVAQEEAQTTVDPRTGTRIYADAGKTVFANWAYVSPGESVTVTYTYLLPFKLFQVTSGGSQVDSYSLVAQKQSGSVGSAFSSKLSYPSGYDMKWKTPDKAGQGENELSLDTQLDTDTFLGAVFEKK